MNSYTEDTKKNTSGRNAFFRISADYITLTHEYEVHEKLKIGNIILHYCNTLYVRLRYQLKRSVRSLRGRGKDHVGSMGKEKWRGTITTKLTVTTRRKRQ
jgi:hypothetical protein